MSKLRKAWIFPVLVLINQEKKKEIWLSPMTKSPIPTENSAYRQHKNATKNFDYKTIADRLRTFSWSNKKSMLILCIFDIAHRNYGNMLWSNVLIY